MQFAAGKFYKTRSGDKAYIIAINPPNLRDEQMAVAVLDCLYRYDKHGKMGNIERFDLVEEWKEPAKKRVFLAMYNSSHDKPFVCHYNTEQECHDSLERCGYTYLGGQYVELVQTENL